MNVTIGGIARTVEITSFDKLGDVKVCMLTTTADGSVGFQQLNQEVVDTIYASFPVDTAKGDIASFEDGADNVPVRELKLNLEPYQNLNGYDYPWVGGAGKNLLPITISSQTYHGITLTVNANGSFTVNGTASEMTIFILTSSLALPDGTYVINGCPSGGGSSTYRLDVNNGSIGQDTGGSATFNVSGGTGISNVRLRIASGCTVSNLVFWPMIRIAGTSNTFEPYENICPIYPSNGKNLFDENLLDTYTSSIVYTSYSVPNGTYTMSSEDFPFDANTANVFFLAGSVSTGANTTNNGVYENRPITITVTDGHYTVAYRSTGVNTNNPKNFRFQIERGNIATEYVPYNAIGITRTGKNLIDLANIQGSGGSVFAEITLPPGTYYTYQFTQNMNHNMYWQYLLDGNAITMTTAGDEYAKTDYSSGSYNRGKNKITLYQKCTIRLTVGQNSNTASYPVDVMLTTDATGYSDFPTGGDTSGYKALMYEPYTTERYYPISDNPVYGGTLEVETGVLTVDRAFIEINGDSNIGKESTGWAANYEAFYFSINSQKGIQPGSNIVPIIISNQMKAETYNRVRGAGIPFVCCIAGGGLYIEWTSTSADLQAEKARLAVTPAQFAYELATPLVYQLTPVQVKTLLGYNNIWTDSGTVEVQYRANIGLYIQKIIGVTEDDMVANQNIAANQYFFVGEELYYSTSAISAGQTIIVGTNCIKTNLADALNALNS